MMKTKLFVACLWFF